MTTEANNEDGILALLLVSGVSFISTLVILIFYMIKRKVVHSFSFDLVIMLCISDFIWASVGLSRSVWMKIERNAELGTFACYLQGIIILTSVLSSLMCTSSISYSLYSSLVLQKPIYREKSAFQLFWKTNFLLPLLMSIAIAICSSYGPVEPYSNTMCFINNQDVLSAYIIRLVFYYTPFLGVLIFNSVVIYRIIQNFRKKSEDYPQINIKEILKLVFYPLVLLICWVPVIIFPILEYFGKVDQKTVEIGHILGNIIGALDVVFYVLISLNPFSFSRSKQNMSSILESFQESQIRTAQEKSSQEILTGEEGSFNERKSIVLKLK